MIDDRDAYEWMVYQKHKNGRTSIVEEHPTKDDANKMLQHCKRAYPDCRFGVARKYGRRA